MPLTCERQLDAGTTGKTAFSGVLMTSPGAQTSAVDAKYTLTRALRWLGHNCCGCPAATEEVLHAPVWFIRRGTTQPTVNLVVIELTGSRLRPEDRRRMLQAVNHCTRPDLIRVRERRDTDGGRALAAVDCEAGRHARADYQVFGGVPTP